MVILELEIRELEHLGIRPHALEREVASALGSHDFRISEEFDSRIVKIEAGQSVIEKWNSKISAPTLNLRGRQYLFHIPMNRFNQFNTGFYDRLDEFPPIPPNPIFKVPAIKNPSKKLLLL